MSATHVGFAVIYRWRLRDGMEERFQRAWERSREQGTADPAAAALMTGAVSESFAPILLDPVRDHLVH